jgi:hypothetical protein
MKEKLWAEGRRRDTNGFEDQSRREERARFFGFEEN